MIAHASGLNGPSYWQWPWRRIDALRIYPAMLAAFIPFAVGQYLYETRRSVVAALLLSMVSMLALELTALGVQSRPFAIADRVVYNIANMSVTSYFGDAAQFTHLRDFLSRYPELLPSFHLHSLTKPPGPVLFHAAVRGIVGDPYSAALSAGLLIGVLGVFSLPAIYFFVAVLGGKKDAGFYGASFFALAPGPVLFFPEFDQVYPILTSALLAAWATALRANHRGWSLAFGLLLSFIGFASYGLLIVGVFLALYSIDLIVAEPEAGKKIAAHLAVAAAAVVAVYGALWLWSGFDPIATFQTAVKHQARITAILGRPQPPATIPFDLADFALGGGWIGILLALFFLARKAGEIESEGREFWVTVFVFAQILAVAVTGVLAVEAARVWIFLLALLMLPVGLELREWSFRSRMATYAALWFLTTAIAQNMAFVS